MGIRYRIRNGLGFVLVCALIAGPIPAAAADLQESSAASETTTPAQPEVLEPGTAVQTKQASALPAESAEPAVPGSSTAPAAADTPTESDIVPAVTPAGPDVVEPAVPGDGQAAAEESPLETGTVGQAPVEQAPSAGDPTTVDAPADTRPVNTPPTEAADELPAKSEELPATTDKSEPAKDEPASKEDKQAATEEPTEKSKPAKPQIAPFSNPVLQSQCGLRVGMLVDLSSSLAGEQQQLKDTASGVLDALAGTSAQLAVLTFAGSAPAAGQSIGNLPLISLVDEAAVVDVRAKIDSLKVVTGGPDVGIGWHSGLLQATGDKGGHFDLLLMLTDGNPELFAYNSGSEGPDNAEMEKLNRAIAAANALKAAGTRIVTIGVGGDSADGTSSTESNLAAISGPTPGADYTLDNDHAGLYGLLGELAGSACESPTAGSTTPETGAEEEADSSTTTSDKADPDKANADKNTITQARKQVAKPARPAKLTLINVVRNGTAGTASADDWALSVIPKKSGNQVVTVPGSAAGTAIEIVAGSHQLSQSAGPAGYTLLSMQCDLGPHGQFIDVHDDGIRLAADEDATCIFTNAFQGIDITKRAGSTAAVVSWTYLISNTGGTAIEGIQVTDDALPASAIDCPTELLAPGASMVCTVSGPFEAVRPG